MTHNFPLTTEEPLHNPQLLQEVQAMNAVDDPHDNQVPTAVIVEKQEPNKLICSTPPPQLAPTVTTTTTVSGALHSSTQQSSRSDDTESDDDELMRITEFNRHIAAPSPSKEDQQQQQQRPRSRSLRSLSVSVRRQLLVFADHPTVIEQQDRIYVQHKYGAGPKGTLEEIESPKREPRSYLVACDFSDESQHAIEWTTGTMMRDGDRLYVVTAVNREDNPEAVKKAGLTLSKELKKASEDVTELSKKALKQMLLFNVDLVTIAVCGRVKNVLLNLIQELDLTMVVCGSRGRGTMTGIFMGSISTFLVHNSPVPVSVIRSQRKKKVVSRKPTRPPPLSQSVKTGQLAVDELSTSAKKDTSTSSKKQ
ncbi:MAG: hypothetical protein EXX96DRAFT_583825 [Benjaminiella poitrasii]|nr:MAG: hypothetical protein EXX96DRAFT_583825 [Benjaminiella poitrasii]